MYQVYKTKLERTRIWFEQRPSATLLLLMQHLLLIEHLSSVPSLDLDTSMHSFHLLFLFLAA